MFDRAFVVSNRWDTYYVECIGGEDAIPGTAKPVTRAQARWLVQSLDDAVVRRLAPRVVDSAYQGDTRGMRASLERWADEGRLRVLHEHKRYAVETAVAAPEMQAPRDAPREAEEPDPWIAIALVDDDGAPVANQRYRVEAGNGKLYQGRLDSQGTARIDGLKSASPCKVTFPDLDGRDWKAA